MQHRTRFWAAGALAAWTCWSYTAAPLTAQEGRPNILLIVVDDMGYSDVGCYGGEIETPNIDQLANRGVRFTQFYNCSRCTSTRASLLSGAYPHRVGMREFGRTMDKSVPTLAENLRDNGYSTGMLGKWHLSELPSLPKDQKRISWMNHQLDLDRPFVELASYPTRRGFEHFFGVIWGVVNHFDPFSLVEGETPVKKVPDDFYMTDAIGQRSVEFIREFSRSDEPFFLYVSYTAPHWPIQAPAEEVAKYQETYARGWDDLRDERFARQQRLGLFASDIPLGKISGRGPRWKDVPTEEQQYQAQKMAVHAAMVDRVDQSVGDIVESLRAADELDNTLILFMSDNGASPEIPGPPGYDRHGATRDGRPALREEGLKKADNRAKLGTDESYTGIGPSWASAVNTPLRYWKYESYEGGCRTPLIVHWPAGNKLQTGSLVDDVGHVIDIAPTCYELANVQTDPRTLQDGLSLAPVLDGQRLNAKRDLYFDHEAGRGIRRQQWKASKLGDRDWELFDLSKDPGETKNLADSNTELLDELVNDWTTWQQEVSTKDSGKVSERINTNQRPK